MITGFTIGFIIYALIVIIGTLCEPEKVTITPIRWSYVLFYMFIFVGLSGAIGYLIAGTQIEYQNECVITSVELRQGD